MGMHRAVRAMRGRRYLIGTLTVLTGVALAGVALAPAADAGPPSPPTFLDGYVVYSAPTAAVTCTSGHPTALHVGFTYDASHLNSGSVNLAISGLTQGDYVTDFLDLGTTNTSIAPGATGTYSHTFAIPSTSFSDTAFGAFSASLTTNPNYGYVGASVSLACPSTGQPASGPTPTITVSHVSCSGQVTVTVDARNATTSWIPNIFGRSAGWSYFGIVDPGQLLTKTVSGVPTTGDVFEVRIGTWDPNSPVGIDFDLGWRVAAPATNCAPPCNTTLTGAQPSLALTHGTTCLVNAHVAGGVAVGRGAGLEVLNSTVNGSMSLNAPSLLWVCGSHTLGIAVNGATGEVRIGDGGACRPNTVNGSIGATHNTGGVWIVNNTVAGSIGASGNTDGQTITGNHH